MNFSNAAYPKTQVCHIKKDTTETCTLPCLMAWTYTRVYSGTFSTLQEQFWPMHFLHHQPLLRTLEIKSGFTLWKSIALNAELCLLLKYVILLLTKLYKKTSIQVWPLTTLQQLYNVPVIQNNQTLQLDQWTILQTPLWEPSLVSQQAVNQDVVCIATEHVIFPSLSI